MKIVTCQTCGNNFETKGTNAKYCQSCNQEIKRARYREIMRRKRQENPEKCRDAYKRWYEKQGVEYHKKWRDTHPEYRQEAIRRATRRSKEHPDLKKKYDATYYQRHKEQLNAKNKAYAQENREKLRDKKHAGLIRYRARLAKAEGNWTAKQFKELCEAVDYYCSYCHKKFDKLTADHIVPLLRGGSNDISNIIPACMSCNAAKGATTPLEFLSPFNFL